MNPGHHFLTDPTVARNSGGTKVKRRVFASLFASTVLLAACGQTASPPATNEAKAGTTPAAGSTGGAASPTANASAGTSVTPTQAAAAGAGATPTTQAATASTPAAKSGAGLSGDIPIGAVWSLTGTAAVYGTSQKNAAQLAVDQINKAGTLGGANLKLNTEDDLSTKEGAIAAFEKLLNEKVVAILGPTLSNS